MQKVFTAAVMIECKRKNLDVFQNFNFEVDKNESVMVREMTSN